MPMKSIMRHFTKRDWFATAGAVVLIALSVWLELLMPEKGGQFGLTIRYAKAGEEILLLFRSARRGSP